MAQYCQRCKREIPEGGLYYHVKLSAISGYDEVIDPGREEHQAALIDDIAGRPPEELEKDVYFEREVIVCYSCRTVLIELFSREAGANDEPAPPPDKLLH